MNQLESGKESNNPSNIFSLWNAPLINYFQTFSHFDVHEIDDALSIRYEQNNHPAAKLIHQLLVATSKFLNRTTLESDFSQSREESNTKDNLKNIFNDMGRTLAQVQSQCNDELINSRGQIVLKAAINYCKTCIELRLQALATSNNRIHIFYLNHDNELKHVIPPPSSVRNKPEMLGH